MKLLNKIVCFFKGHVPLGSIKVEPVPPPTGPQHIVFGVGTQGTWSAVDSFVSRPAGDSILNINAGPMKAKLGVCMRCASVYWKSQPDMTAITDVANVPELQEYYDWKKRELWEQEQREHNEAAAALHKQYRMALKLAGDQRPSCDEV